MLQNTYAHVTAEFRRPSRPNSVDTEPRLKLAERCPPTRSVGALDVGTDADALLVAADRRARADVRASKTPARPRSLPTAPTQSRPTRRATWRRLTLIAMAGKVGPSAPQEIVEQHPRQSPRAPSALHLVATTGSTRFPRRGKRR